MAPPAVQRLCRLRLHLRPFAALEQGCLPGRIVNVFQIFFYRHPEYVFLAKSRPGVVEGYKTSPPRGL